MRTVEELTKEAVRNDLRGLTLWSTDDKRWQASVTYDDSAWRVEIDADPVAALTKVLGGSSPVSELTIDEDIFG